MQQWSKEELTQFRAGQTIQNKPLDEDRVTIEEDNPIWVVVVSNRVFVRAAKGRRSRWYRAGIQNGGFVRLCCHDLPVTYLAVDDDQLIATVTAEYQRKYQWQLPVRLMASTAVAQATVELVKRQLRKEDQK